MSVIIASRSFLIQLIDTTPDYGSIIMKCNKTQSLSIINDVCNTYIRQARCILSDLLIALTFVPQCVDLPQIEQFSLRA